MGLDPADTAALVAALTARSDAGASFELVTASAPAGTGVQPSPTVAPATTLAFSPQTQSVTVVSWTATYRNTRLGGVLVCDTGVASVATGVLALSALAAFDLTDLRLASLGSPLPSSSTDNAPAWPYAT
jgi:hypothetical protein